MSIQLQKSGGGLTHSQRNRLIKSTRKLGMVLGETPTVDRVSDSSSSSLHRRPSTSYSATTSTKPSSSSYDTHGRPSLSLARTSTSSSTSSNSRPSLSLPPVPSLPPVINITAALPSPVSPNDGTQQPSTPLSPTFGLLNRDSPFCPADSEFESHRREANIRRKKMAKLVRTFGENVPPELVTIGHLGAGLSLDATGGIGSGGGLRGRRSSQSLNDESLAGSRRKYGGVDMKRLSSSSTTTSLSFSDSSSQRSVAYPAHTKVQMSNPPSSPNKSISRSKTLHSTTHPRSTRLVSGPGSGPQSQSSHPHQHHHHHQRTISTTENYSSTDRELAFARLTGGGSGVPSAPEMVVTPSKQKNPNLQHLAVQETHRKGREWSGEWNQRDMQHVVNQLRRLK